MSDKPDTAKARADISHVRRAASFLEQDDIAELLDVLKGYERCCDYIDGQSPPATPKSNEWRELANSALSWIGDELSTGEDLALALLAAADTCDQKDAIIAKLRELLATLCQCDAKEGYTCRMHKGLAAIDAAPKGKLR